MNKQQKAYAQAKARYEAALDAERAAEAEYIKRHDIRSDDGTQPRVLHAIECSDERFDEILQAIDESGELAEVYAERTEAGLALRKAEDELIEYGLRLLPEKEAATLRRAKDRLQYREKIIDLTFRLDTRTVRRRA